MSLPRALGLLLRLTAALLLCIAPLAAQSGTALFADRMLDVRSGELIDDVIVFVDGEVITRIETLRPFASIEAQELDRIGANYQVQVLGDVTLLPGLIDCHTHLNSDLEGDWVHRSVVDGPADSALRGARNAKITLHAGFTTVRDVGAGGFADVALMRAIDKGFVEGPRMFPAGHTIGITGGHADTTGYRPGIAERGPEQGIADGVDEVVQAVRYQIKHGAKVIKTCATAGVLSHEGPVGAQQYSLEELEAMVAEASRHGIKVAAHAHGTEGIIAAVKAGVASIEHGSVLTDEAIRLMKEHGTYLVPTTYLADAIDLDQLPAMIRAKAESILPEAKRSVSKAIAAGVKLAFGTDAAVYPHGLNAREFAALVQRGMTPLAAIQSATLGATDLIGVDDRGVIAAGKLADLIAVPGNPLTDVSLLESVHFVMKGGVIAVSKVSEAR